jgi:septal ring factor EnvC (AmiA/AmiB activator)
VDRELLKESIKQVEASVKTSRDNLKKAQQHIDEGEVILKALKESLKCISTQ